jgi:hypothetical protein
MLKLSGRSSGFKQGRLADEEVCLLQIEQPG